MNYCNLPQFRENISKNSELNKKISLEDIKNLIKQIQGNDFNEELKNSRMRDCNEPTTLYIKFLSLTTLLVRSSVAGRENRVELCLMSKAMKTVISPVSSTVI